MKILIIGAGLSGATAANLLKNSGHEVQIFETRNHIAGNCYDSNVYGTIVHNYGPHIFHTNDEDIFKFLSQFTEWIPFQYKPKGVTKLGVVSLPYSKKTQNELKRELSQEEIVDVIFKDYSEKQWGVPFEEIPKSITNRIPKTKDCVDPTWFEGQKYQCIPKEGYTKMFEKMLQGIHVKLNCNNDDWKKAKADITIYTGKIDEYFNYCYGQLPYRSLRFKHTTSENKFDVVTYNQNTKMVDYTRTYDHSHFTANHKGTTIITEEYPEPYNGKNIPFYPIPWGEGLQMYAKYKKLADKENKTIFIGRLATYTYLDMWMAVKQCMIKLKPLLKIYQD
jgi:UDP-galactopyranose mutase